MLANLLTDCKFTVVDTGHTAGTTTITTSALDMTGFDAVCFVCCLGTVTSTAVLTLAAQDCATSGGSYVAISGASVSITDSGGATSNELIILDVLLPQLQFVEATLTRGTANAAVDMIVAIQYRAKSKATTQPASVAASLLALAAT